MNENRKQPIDSDVCSRDLLLGLGFKPDAEEKIWSFDTLQKLLDYLQRLSFSPRMKNLSGFFVMNANPMMRTRDITYIDFLKRLITAGVKREDSVRTIVTGSDLVAQEIVSDPALRDVLLENEGLNINQKLKSELAEVEERINGKEAELKNLSNPKFGTPKHASNNAVPLKSELEKLRYKRYQLKDAIDADISSDIKKYKNSCLSFLNDLQKISKETGLFELIPVYSANRIPWFIFSLTMEVPGEDCKTIVLQAFLDTRNLGRSYDREAKSFCVPGVVSFDTKYNSWLNILCENLRDRFQREYDALAPLAERNMTIMMFSFDAPTASLPNGGTETTSDAVHQFRYWLYEIGRDIYLATRSVEKEPQESPEKIVIVPTSSGIAICLLGSLVDIDKSEPKTERFKRIDQAIDFAWHILEARSKEKEGTFLRFSAAVYETTDKLIWAPNGSVTVAGNSISFGADRLRKPIDGNLYLENKTKSALSEDSPAKSIQWIPCNEERRDEHVDERNATWFCFSVTRLFHIVAVRTKRELDLSEELLDGPNEKRMHYQYSDEKKQFFLNAWYFEEDSPTSALEFSASFMRSHGREYRLGAERFDLVVFSNEDRFLPPRGNGLQVSGAPCKEILEEMDQETSQTLGWDQFLVCDTLSSHISGPKKVKEIAKIGQTKGWLIMETTNGSSVGASVPNRGQNNLWFHRNEASDTVFVFIHGVLSDSRCWLYEDKKKKVYWPALIKSDSRFGNPALFLSGYYTAVDAGRYEIRNCADEVFGAIGRKDLMGTRPVMDKQKIVFVCHSMGGIVARYMLEANSEVFSEKQIGLVLIASPSYGSKYANTLELILKYYNHYAGMQLQYGDWSIRDLDDRFKDLNNKKRIPGLCGVELYENHFPVPTWLAFLKWRWIPFRQRRVVVPKESAGRYFGAAKLMRNTDHFSIVKPGGTDHPTHQALLDFVTNNGFVEH